MRLLQDILIVIAKILIAIGDLVILLAQNAFKTYKNCRKYLLKQVKKIRRSSGTVHVQGRRILKAKVPRFNFNIPSLSLQLPKKNKKRGRKAKVAIVPYRTKLKYFTLGSFASALFLFLPLLFVILLQNLPNPRELSQQDIAQTTKIYDRNGILLYQIFANQNRTVIPLSQIPDDLKNATIAIEDERFYKTPGFDIEAIIRSAIADLRGEPLQGGSTITQQLIKARLLTPERSIERKVKEVILAAWADKIYTKDQILEMYFNQVPFGGTAWGAEAAAQTYFGKNAKDLDLAESAFLAGLPRAPSIYSPYGEYPGLWKKRQHDVLNRMAHLGFVTKDEAEAAKKRELSFKPNSYILHAPHFVMHVKDLLVRKYGLATVERGGLIVTTTLDLKTQNMAQEIVTEEVEKGSYLNFTNAASLITNPKNGDILAMVGGKDYYDENGGKYNVTTALRQPGSTIKVVTYAAALMNGMTAATPITDAPIAYASAGSPPYRPVNYDGRFHGNVTLRNALGNSINIPAVKTLNTVGIDTFLSLAEKMGISTWKSPENYGLALTLGSAEVRMTEMAELYGSLANKGKRVELNPIQKVVNYQGQVLEEKGKVRGREALPEEVAFIISNILSDNRARALAFGLNSPLVIPGHTVSVKTGTTDNKRDNWTIGYTPNILTAVWVGNNDNTPMNPAFASGITGAAPIWNKIMSNLLAKSNPKDEIYEVPEEVVTASCGGRDEFFIAGTESRSQCRPIGRSLDN
jgi:1A family penicillin-binding protein